jgi:uncharacterized membrane protein YqaE (UPF0057 family)
MKNTFKLIAIAAFSALFMTSCAESMSIHKKRYSKGYFVASSKKIKTSETIAKEENTNVKKTQRNIEVQHTETTLSSKETVTTPTVNETFIAGNSASVTITPNKVKTTFHVTEKPMAIENTAISTTSHISTLNKKDLRKELRKSRVSGDDKMVIYVLLSIFIPPLAVYLQRDLGTDFWINLILTLLFWVPGVIHALLITFDVI